MATKRNCDSANNSDKPKSAAFMKKIKVPNERQISFAKIYAENKDSVKL